VSSSRRTVDRTARNRAVEATPELRQWPRFVADARHDARVAAGGAGVLLAANLRMRYRRTLLGYAWLILPTAATAIVWTYVQRSGFVSLGHTRVSFAAHVLAGTVVWQLLVDAMNVPLQELKAQGHAVRRTKVPVEAVVLAGVLEVLATSVFRLLIVIPVLTLLGVDLRVTMMLAPIGLVVAVMLGVAIGLALTPLGLLLDDIGRGLAIVTGVWFLLTPIVYAHAHGGVVRWNPATPVVVVTRSWLTGEPSSSTLVPVAAGSLVAVAVAWLLMRLARPHVVSRLG
jgi:lipopolysaccharide transport system permease protein